MVTKREEILFKRGVKVQGLNRVALPRELLENLNLKEGDNIAIYYDHEKKTINIKKDASQ